MDRRVTIEHAWLADFFVRLAVLEQAGIAPQQALLSLARGAPAAEKIALERAARWCGRGASLAKSLPRAGLVGPLDARVLEAAETSGRLESAYRDLAARHAAADARRRRLRGKLLLPGLVLVLAAFVKPFPAFFLGALSLLDYLLASLGLLVGIGGGMWLLLVLARGLGKTDWGRSVGQWLLSWPMLGALPIRRERARFMEALAMLFASGVPLTSALETAVGTVSLGRLHEAFRQVRVRVDAGATLEQAFAVCPYIGQQSKLLVRSAELAGTLDDTLGRIARMEREELESLENAWATWVPRVAYILVAIWMASGILAGGPLTAMPDDL